MLAVVPALSFAVTVMLADPGVVAVPLSTPAGESVSPEGRPVAENVDEPTPPLAEIVAVYGAPTVAFGSEAGAMVRAAAAIVTVNVWLAVWPFESVTVAVTVEVPGVVGVPDRLPDELPVRPPGKPENANVYPAVPPVAVSVPEYAAPTEPFGRVPPMVSGAGAMTTVNVWLTCALVLSVAVTVTEKVPAAVGVPVTEPAAKERPSGRPVAVYV